MGQNRVALALPKSETMRKAQLPPTPGAGRSPLAELLLLAAPVAATMVSYTLKQFVDALMVSRLGPAELAAQGNGAAMAFVLISVVMGLTTVVNTFASQHLGAGSAAEGSRYAWAGQWLCLGVWALVFVPAGLLLGWAMRDVPELLERAHIGSGVEAYDPRVMAMQVEYGQILLLGAFFTNGGRAIAQWFYGVHRPATVFVSTVAGNVVNIVMNWLLIFGALGFPELGLRGAAYATVIGSAVEWGAPMVVFLSARFDARYATRRAWRCGRRHFAGIVRLGWPVALSFGNEMACWSIFMAGLVGGVSVADNAAGWIGLRYMQLSFLPAIGIGMAVTALVGRQLGAGRPDLAEKRAWLGVRVTMAYMGVCALVFLVFREQLVGVFVDGAAGQAERAEIVSIGVKVMICAAVFQVFDALGITLQGALRGAGDTAWPSAMNVGLAWLLIVGGAWAMLRLAPGLGSIGPWMAASAYIIALSFALLWRFRRGGWRERRVVDWEGAAA